MNKESLLEQLEEEKDNIINEIERQLESCQHTLDDTKKHQSIVFDKLQYIRNRHHININFNHRLDGYLSSYLDEVKSIIDRKIYEIEDERESFLKYYNRRYHEILEGEYELKDTKFTS
ncbi:hypothetical protein [Macrococcus sp. DPC7161]|uniref:hypothetical protein n=1 Tax=Macrococcus sp. DPC7161 TaxID=2507060 RepID=UPI00100B82BA|nr:hypothetical protein [Macrococcus sp. DPC7161]RXK18351.1 hypothetical protein ER639_06580 [Macrococcus sp. DPC7161]